MKSKADKSWDAILYGEKMLSDEEAEEMQEVVRKMRKENGFRIKKVVIPD